MANISTFITNKLTNLIRDIVGAPRRREIARPGETVNNDMSKLQNEKRINERIPDIYGKIRAVPDLISEPYYEYDNGILTEWSYFCVGRGFYEINKSEVFDTDTPVEDMLNIDIEFYEPGNNPLNGAPYQTIGNSIERPLQKSVLFESFSNIEIKSNWWADILGRKYFENSSTQQYNLVVYWTTDTFVIDKAFTEADDIPDLRTLYKIGDLFIIESAGGPYDGYYKVLSVGENFITVEENLAEPAPGASEPYITGFTYIGLSKFKTDTLETDLTTLNELIFNFQFSSGLHRTTSGSSKNKIAYFSVRVRLENLDLPDFHPNKVTLKSYRVASAPSPGTSLDVDEIITQDPDGGFSLKLDNVPESGRYAVQVERLDYYDETYGWERGPESSKIQSESLSDGCSLREVFINTPIPTDLDLGDITTIYMKASARTTGSPDPDNRELNMIVTRKIPELIYIDPNWTYDPDGPKIATQEADDIFCHIATNPFLGRLPVSNLDLNNIANTVIEIGSYFDSDKCRQFNGSFDESDISGQEMLEKVAEAIFCRPYRRDSQIKLYFDSVEDFEFPLSTVKYIFNHANIIKGTEKRALSLGNNDERDGVEIEWTDSLNRKDKIESVPEDTPLTNPMTLFFFGITNRIQARFKAERMWAKIQYQNKVAFFTCTDEGALVELGDRVFIANNNKPNSNDGEVLDYSYPNLTLSQPLRDIDPGKSYQIFVQMKNAIISTAPISSGSTGDTVITLGSTLSQPPVTGVDKYARATYIVTESTESPEAYVVTSRKQVSQQEWEIEALEYNVKIYEKDLLKKNEEIDDEGRKNYIFIDSLTGPDSMTDQLADDDTIEDRIE